MGAKSPTDAKMQAYLGRDTPPRWPAAHLNEEARSGFQSQPSASRWDRDRIRAGGFHRDRIRNAISAGDNSSVVRLRAFYGGFGGV